MHRKSQSFDVVSPSQTNVLGLTIWTLNTCTLKSCDLIPLAHSFADNSCWDAICIQEGSYGLSPGVATDSGITIVTGHTDTVGAPHLLLNHRLGSRIRKTSRHSHFVIVELALTPPVLLFSLYLPPFSSHGAASFETTLDHFKTELESMQEASPGSFVLGGADCNTQLPQVESRVGPHTGTIDRPVDRDRGDVLQALLSSLDLKVPTSYANLGPTRIPWPGQLAKQKPSVIDYIMSSHKLHCQVITSDIPTPATATDHTPIGLTAFAPYKSRKERRRNFEHLLSTNVNQPQKIQTAWTPGNPIDFHIRMHNLPITNLHNIPNQMREVANSTPAQSTQQSQTKKRLLDGIRKAEDQVTRKAFQIHLQDYHRTQRQQKEYDKLLSGARGDKWHFSKEAQIPSRAHIPDNISEDYDRGNWGHTLATYLHDLYGPAAQEADQIHRLLRDILHQASQQHCQPLECLPTELRDIIKQTPPRKAAGPDGIPSQFFHQLSFKQISTIANLFTTLSNDLDYHSAHRPDLWNLANAIMLPKQTNATTLDKHRTISLMNQLQKLYGKWLTCQASPLLDNTLSESQLGFWRQRQASEAIHTLQRLTELSLEWEQPLTILRLDIRKAFDRMSQSAIPRYALHLSSPQTPCF